jgi:serine/threonine-protein kinase
MYAVVMAVALVMRATSGAPMCGQVACGLSVRGPMPAGVASLENVPRALSSAATACHAIVERTMQERAESRLQGFFRKLAERMSGPGKVSTVSIMADEASQRPSQPSVPVFIGQRFEDRGLVAEGGMAKILRRFDRAIQREVAVKCIEAPTEHEQMRFIEEAQITGQLEHPNIVPIHDIALRDSGEAESFSMKLIEGDTLHALLSVYSDGEGPSDRELEPLLQIFLKVCDAVAFAHSRGVIHRDLKPHNIMVGSFGQVYVMDWGLAKLVEGARASEGAGRDAWRRADNDQRRVSLSMSPRKEQRGEVYGTPAYMAMEQAFGDVDSIDERTDVFGLGGILYEILTQHPPHTSTQTIISGQIPDPRTMVPGRALPARLCEIAMKALQADQNDRYPSVSALREAVSEFVRSGGWFSTARFAAGQDILREGERDRTAYIIEEGVCEVWHDVGGEREVAGVLGKGDPFGEAALFSDMPRTANVTAVTDVTVAVITPETLDRELAGHSWMRALLKALATRFVTTDRELRQERGSRRPSQVE